MSRMAGIGNRLYSGEKSFNIVGRRRTWYTVSVALVLACLAFLIGPGVNLGIEFTGGTVFQVSAPAGSVEQARDVVESAGGGEAVITESSEGRLRIQTESLEAPDRQKVLVALAEEFDQPVEEVDVQFVGPSWGKEITQKALTGLVIFLVFVVIFLSTYFEWKMAFAALVALLQDVVITVGVYAITGLEVTPATVVGVLTILGYSLYDTVVVFDKVKDNTKGLAGGSRATYSETANLSVNQTLVRSVNTSVVALLPVIAILVGAVGALGANTLSEVAVALFVGMIAGTFSSIFIATPVLCDLKEREPEMQALRKRVAQRRAGVAKQTKGAAASGKGAKAAKAGGTTAVLEADANEAGDEESDETPSAGSGATSPRNQPTRKKKKRR